VGTVAVVLVRYLDCTNFEGKKILVFKDANQLLKELNTGLPNTLRLDPHFSKSLDSPFARFKPTTEGWAFALKFAALLSE
jgi:hypothetical protein